jgi:hypothetical protein
MQMCRWFGYRPGYDDLCRVFLPYESLQWYSFITASINELYGELDLMSRAEKKPKDFGLKVRDHPGAMVVTAKNKMSTAETEIRSQSMWGQILKRFRFRKDDIINKKNLSFTDNFVSEVKSLATKEYRVKDVGPIIFEGVPYSKLIEYIQGMDLVEDGLGDAALIRQLKQMESAGLPLPKVCLMNQSGKGTLPTWLDKLSKGDQEFIGSTQVIAGYSHINLLKRTMNDDGANFSSRSLNLGNSDDEKLFLDETERRRIKDEIGKPASIHYLASAERTFPALIIYPFALVVKTPYGAKKHEEYEVSLGHGTCVSIGYSISIPRPESLRNMDPKELKNLLAGTRHSYQVNKVYQAEFNQRDMFESDEDE